VPIFNQESHRFDFGIGNQLFKLLCTHIRET
jgi:CelD/BcsL family acetyltransferase involved in cellulose biosynthesis